MAEDHSSRLSKPGLAVEEAIFHEHDGAGFARAIIRIYRNCFT